MISLLARTWSKLPLWLHILAARIARPKFRVAVAALAFDERGRVLLFRHTYRKFEWGIPAGSLEYDEQPREAIAREFFEESGIQIHVEELLTAVSAQVDHHVSLIYRCTLAHNQFQPSHEISEMQYFDPSDLPRMLVEEKELIRRAAAALRKDA